MTFVTSDTFMNVLTAKPVTAAFNLKMLLFVVGSSGMTSGLMLGWGGGAEHLAVWKSNIT